MIKNAILKSFSPSAFTATIQIAGSRQAYLEGIQVARHIPPAEMIVGRRLVVLFTDKTNPADAVVIAVY
jgi:hypothetical protein